LASDGAIVFEIGEGQGDGVARLFTDEGFDEVETRPDLAGIDRAVIARRA
jgi:methylase of polypeptide subunit release factors